MNVCTVLLQNGSYVVDAAIGSIIREATLRGDETLRIPARCAVHDDIHEVNILLGDVVSVIRHGRQETQPDGAKVITLYR